MSDMTEDKEGYWHERYVECKRELAEARKWKPIESAPSGEGGPHNVKDPAYIPPPRILLYTDNGIDEGITVGYYDWYYHPGYGLGHEERPDTAWCDCHGGPIYPTHWMPLPDAPRGGEVEK